MASWSLNPSLNIMSWTAMRMIGMVSNRQLPSRGWKKRSVVSSFILKWNDGPPQVALFRRSDKVSTYR